MLALGGASLLMSIATCVFCFLIFGHLSEDPNVRKVLYICFIAKALTWSPFLGAEYYDTLFEHVYHDVQYQLNVIKPYTSRSASPSRTQGAKSSARDSRQLATIREQNQQTLLEESDEDDDTAERDQAPHPGY